MGLTVESVDFLPEKLRQQAKEKLKEKSASSKRKNKYNSRKCTVSGITFDSEKEARRYLVLRDMQKRGEISELKLQHSFTLQESYVTAAGEKVGKIVYVGQLLGY